MKDSLVTPIDKVNLTQPPIVERVDEIDVDVDKDATAEALVGNTQTYIKASPYFGDISPYQSGGNTNSEPDSGFKPEINVTKKLHFSPMAPESPAVSTIRTEELSSFFISPVTATNDGCSVRSSSFSDVMPTGTLFSVVEKGAAAASNNMSASSNVMIACDDTEVQLENEDLSNPYFMDVDEEPVGNDTVVDEDNQCATSAVEEVTFSENGRPVRKRKPTDFFDGDKVQPKKPRAPRAKKVVAAVGEATSPSAKAAAPEKMSVEEEMAIALADDDQDENIDPRDADEYNPINGKKKRSAASSGAKRANKKAAIIPTVDGDQDVSIQEETAPAVAAPVEPIVLPAEVQMKISKFTDRITDLTAELHSMEK